MHASQETDFWHTPCFLSPPLTGAVAGSGSADYIGAPPPILFAVWKFLNNVFSGTIDKTDWTSNMDYLSPDLNHLDFYLWGYSKPTVYSTKVCDVRDLQQRTQNGFEIIRITAVIFQQDRQSLLRRTRFCLEAYGGHWPFAVIVKVAVSRKPCFGRCMFIFSRSVV